MVITGAAGMLLPSCNDIMGGLYDEPDQTSEYGFVEPCTETHSGLIYVNSSDYETWTYIDFENRIIDSLPVEEPAPAHWDIAIHRYDAKTDNARVIGTELTDINEARTWRDTGEEKGVADIWTTDKIVTDMSTMMEGYLGYVDSYYNPELSEWLDVDTSTMPPNYTLSGKVYIILLQDGKKAAVKLIDFMNQAGIKGYMTLQYIYPL